MYLGILPSLVNIYKQFGYFRPDSRQINQISDKSSIRLPFTINNTYIQHSGILLSIVKLYKQFDHFRLDFYQIIPN